VTSWKSIAQKIPGRTNKDCRKRFHNAVGRSLKKVGYTNVDYDINLTKFRVLGPTRRILCSRLKLQSLGLPGRWLQRRWRRGVLTVCFHPLLPQWGWMCNGTWLLTMSECLVQETFFRYIARHANFELLSECAKRWQHCLDPKLDHSSWAEEENIRLLNAVKTYGTPWKYIQTHLFPERSANNVKNQWVKRWYANIRPILY